MKPWTLAQADQWLHWIHDEYDDIDYRYFYFAYLAASSGGPHRGEVTMTVEADGVSILQAGYRDRGIRLTDESERSLLVARLQQRYCGDRYASMHEWEQARHEEFREEAQWRYGSSR